MEKNFSLKETSPVGVVTIFDNGHIGYRKVKGNGSVGASKGLYKKTASKLFKAIYGVDKEYSFKSIIPSHIKWVANDEELVLVWTKKTSIQSLSFRNGSNLKGKENYTYEYAVPNLCFKIKGTSLSVVAYKSFGLNKLAYFAPFTNMNVSVCMGSASLKYEKYDHYEDIIEYAEAQFFNSIFTHQEESYHKLGRNKKNYDNNWLKRIENKSFGGYRTLKDFINGKI